VSQALIRKSLADPVKCQTSQRTYGYTNGPSSSTNTRTPANGTNCSKTSSSYHTSTRNTTRSSGTRSFRYFITFSH
jgi:hypothetical protein